MNKQELIKAVECREHWESIDDIISKALDGHTIVPVDSVDKADAIIKAVAHIGIDFGYGVYELEQRVIDSARSMLEDQKALLSANSEGEE